MPTAHCLTIEVQSDSVAASAAQSGVGYMVTFTLPANMDGEDPQQHPSFEAWSTAVRAAVMAAGDQPFHAEDYMRKVALATLMHDLAEINRQFPLRIGASLDTPAVQIHATDPAAPQIEIDFTDEDGHFSVVENHPGFGPNVAVREQGRLGLMPAGRRAFPFDKPDLARKTPPPRPRRPKPPRL